jgi:hypothetical protein
LHVKVVVGQVRRKCVGGEGNAASSFDYSRYINEMRSVLQFRYSRIVSSSKCDRRPLDRCNPSANQGAAQFAGCGGVDVDLASELRDGCQRHPSMAQTMTAPSAGGGFALQMPPPTEFIVPASPAQWGSIASFG